MVSRSRACFADPPALSPSTRNSSLSAGSVLVQSASLPGRFRRWLTADLRRTAAAADRLAWRALAAWMIRWTTAWAWVGWALSQPSRAGLTAPDSIPRTDGLLSLSLV